jgi:chromosome segregation ATPase
MRRKIVLWGSNEKDEKLLIALELLEKENVVNIFTFPENVATEEFYKAMSEKWRDDEEVEFPSTFNKIERKLSVSDSILPDDIRVERPDLITRAQAEWQFVVLSSKLYEMYKGELEEIKEKVDGLTEYQNDKWTELKEFWDKVQGQLNDKNLFREHGAALKEKTNLLFDKLKGLRKELDNQFESQSKGFAESFKTEIKEIEEKLEKGLGLNPLFEDLKKLQAKIREFKFTKDDREDLWSKIDATFKKLKEQRGSQGGAANNNNLARLESRLTGLHGAIQKMERSINFDKRDLDDQVKREADSGGQLEVQLRQAKIRMIEERLKSKEEKLSDMYVTQKEIETRIEKEKKRMVKVEKHEKLEEAKEVVKQKIASDIAEQSKEMDKIADKLEKAATDLQKPKKEASFFEKITESVEQLVEDIVDTAKAVAEVVGEKLDDVKDKVEDLADQAKDKTADLKATAKDKFEDLADKADDLKGAAKDKFEDLTDKADDLKDKIKDKLEDLTDQAKDKFNDLVSGLDKDTDDNQKDA